MASAVPEGKILIVRALHRVLGISLKGLLMNYCINTCVNSWHTSRASLLHGKSGRKFLKAVDWVLIWVLIYNPTQDTFIAFV